jgi:hypothetical protein
VWEPTVAVWICFLVMASLQAEFLRVCDTGYLERVKQLLGKGVDINTQNNVCVFNEFVF